MAREKRDISEMAGDMPKLVTPAEAARLLSVSSPTLRLMTRTGRLPAYVVHGSRRYDVADLRAYLMSHRQEAMATA